MHKLHTVLLIILLLLLVSVIYYIRLINKNKEGKNPAEYYRRQFALLSTAGKAAVLAKKIQQAWDLYIKIRDNIPKMKKMLEQLTDWNYLKGKMCTWASNKQLLAGIIALIKKAIARPNIKPILKNALEKFKNILVKIQATIASILAVNDILSILIPSMPSQVNTAIDVFKNIDSNLLDLFSKAGVNICG